MIGWICLVKSIFSSAIALAEMARSRQAPIDRKRFIKFIPQLVTSSLANSTQVIRTRSQRVESVHEERERGKGRSYRISNIPAASAAAAPKKTVNSANDEATRIMRARAMVCLRCGGLLYVPHDRKIGKSFLHSHAGGRGPTPSSMACVEHWPIAQFFSTSRRMCPKVTLIKS